MKVNSMLNKEINFSDINSDIMHNPMQTDGFEFVEFSQVDDDGKMHDLFISMGFTLMAKHKSKNVKLYQQGQINFILNHEKNCFANDFAKKHNDSICAIAIRVKDAEFALNRALSLGADPFIPKSNDNSTIPAIYGVGGSLIYFVDRYNEQSVYDNDFIFIKDKKIQHGSGLDIIDHLTNNVYQGEMNKWCEYYEKLFNFKEIRYFHITGKKTGLLSRAMISPCGKIRIPINEPTEEASQIAEYLREYNGQGVQHVALTTNDIINSVQTLKNNGIEFLDITPTYYQVIKERFPKLELDFEALRKNHILIDGELNGDKFNMLYQIFTQTLIGPIFFEIIQRKGHQGFGEGNFSALFESMERDQEKRSAI